MYWLLVELTPILFIYFVHYRNFQEQPKSENLNSGTARFTADI